MESGPQDPLLATYRRMTLLGLVFVVFLSGVAEADPILLRRTELLARGALAMGLAFWCVADATLRGRHEVWHIQWQLWTSWPVMLPAYVIATRRWRAVPILVASAVGAVAVGFTGRIVGEYIMAPP
jgi:hypothetical protein